jgi:hypothetical protein
MAKKGVLTQKQWSDIEKRLFAGEGSRALSKEFGVPESTIRTRYSAQNKKVKEVVNQVIAAEENFYSLPIAAQVSAQSLINELRAVSFHLVGAAKQGAMTAHKLSGIANLQVDKIDETNPLSEESQPALEAIAALTKVSNDSARIGIELIKSTKDSMNKEPTKEEQKQVSFYIPDNGRN